MIDGKILVEKLIKYAEKFLYLKQRDEIYFRNILLREFKLTEPYNKEIDLSKVENLDVPDELTNEIEEYVVKNNLIDESLKNLFSTYIFGLLSPLPSKVNEDFRAIKEKDGIEKACDYLYNLSIKNNYIQKTAIGKNLKWTYNDNNGKYLEITINLSKPEKNNKDIAKLLTAPKTSKYPECLLCKENEGFEGNTTHPARENIRTVSVTLGNEPWFVQYSPYAYYEEHLIAISNRHSPMHIKEDTVDKLLDFVDYFPNYMIGSNAALPIIGGSILNHEHFQGGKHLMPMHKAPVIDKKLSSKRYKRVKIGIVDWYNSVIRLESKDRKQISDLSKDIIKAWETYSDKENYIFSETDGVRHNSLSPICRLEGKKYIMDMILRNNITNEEYPDGVFHAHPEYHNIKKEGIGLIEAMGLFILPGRLKKQLDMISDILCKKEKYNKDEINDPENYLYVHREMIEELLKDGYVKTKKEGERKVTDKVNEVCKNILKNTAVFKDDEKGKKGFMTFLNTVGIM